MAQRYITDSGIVLYEPGTIVSTKVEATTTGTPTIGVITLIGESDEGPHFSKESDLDRNGFAPDEFPRVLAKYGSGRLVDAFKALTAPSGDGRIVGGPSEIKIVKTNDSIAAEAQVERSGFGTYSELVAKREGVGGNMIRYKSETSQQESAPATSWFAYCPLFEEAASFALRANGSSKKSISVTTSMEAPALMAAIEDRVRGIMCQGGEKILAVNTHEDIELTATVSGDNLLVSLPSGELFDGDIEVGDSIVIPQSGSYGAIADSVISGEPGNPRANQGSYIVMQISNTLSSALITLKPINIEGALVDSEGAIPADGTDIIVFKKLKISNITGMDRKVADGMSVDWVTYVDGANVEIEIDSGEMFADEPKVNDYLVLGSNFASLNAGFYMISAVTDAPKAKISAYRLSSGAAGSAGSFTGVAGFKVLKPVIDGLSKSMEIEGDVSDYFIAESGDGVPFSNSLLLSLSEYVNTFTVTKERISDTWTVGGDVILKIGSTKENTKISVQSDKLVIYDGVNVMLTAMFKEVKTLADFVALVNSLPGFSAELGKSKFAVLPLSVLDEGEYLVASSQGFMPGRIKNDANEWYSESAAAVFISASQPTSGLPEEVFPEQFLEGGAKKGTTSMAFVSALTACEVVNTNFIASLISQDADQDMAIGETESDSTYTVDAINALVRSHCLSMSTEKAKKNRQGFISRRGTFEEQQEAVGDYAATFRTTMTIDDVNLVSAEGEIKTYQPWMTAVLVAGMQAAAGARGIVKRFVNVSGVKHHGGGFDSRFISDRERALRSGLMALESVRTGGYRWISDQTTYQIDDNFVFNSIQAVYVADLIALRLIDLYDSNVVGESVADVGAAFGLSLLESDMLILKRLGWIAASDDAPLGYRNARVVLQGGVMKVYVEVKLAGLIYFVPISLSISEVTQTA